MTPNVAAKDSRVAGRHIPPAVVRLQRSAQQIDCWTGAIYV